ncbi:DEAD/DEAH box helicase [Candidatus Laterigemmans baculatus]|uniref:DEAD/DEAH box helicase n=1 Tax=Candidatus Laterigemmans baculatus TaxID=2770505 RepID=UPI0013DC065F|nr:DEAD/DEAH box helicase [Candidatus Laterigemmans baculatus]
MEFVDLGLAEPLLRAIDGAGYATPTPIQERAIPSIIAGRDVLGCAQTGTGKTAAFALPILHRLLADPLPRKARRWIRVLILSPTRELAAQIGDNFQQYARRTKLRETVIFGGVGQSAQTRALEAGVDVVIATPGRLLDLMNQGYVDLRSVETFVLDEADQMLDMGFLPDVKRIIAKLPKDRQTLFFSATMPPGIRQLADQILTDPVSVQIAPQGVTADRVDQEVYLVEQTRKPALLAHFLATRPPGSTLVFSRTKHGADAVVRRLNKAGIPALAIHGNKSQNNRQRSLNQFKSGEVEILVATDIAARGIDVSGINYVINYDMPNLPETYVHRIGRTGRAGEAGIAVSFCNSEERIHLRAIEKQLKKKLPVAADALDLADPAAAPLKTEPAAAPRRGPSTRSRGARSTPKPSSRRRRS